MTLIKLRRFSYEFKKECYKDTYWYLHDYIGWHTQNAYYLESEGN